MRHKKLTFYALRRKILNFLASNVHDCVSKVMFVSKEAIFCIVASSSCRLIAYSS